VSKCSDPVGDMPCGKVIDRAQLTRVSVGIASMMAAGAAGFGAQAQEAAKQEAVPLPPLEVTTQKAKPKSKPKKSTAGSSVSPAPQAAPAPTPAPPSPAAVTADQTDAFTPASGNSLEAGTGIGRLPGSIQETPQVVNVIPQKQLQQQNATTVDQALRAVPGVTVAIGEGGGGFNGDQFRIRGFEAKGDLYVDGLRDFGVYVRDSFATEEVQVLKGPSSESFGAGTTGGVINLRQKSAHLGDSARMDFSAGTGPLFRTTVDVNKQIDSTTAMRAVAMWHDQEVVDRDHVESNRWGFLGSLGFGLGTDTTWIVNYLHQQGDRTPDYGVPNMLRPGTTNGGAPITEFGVDRSTFYGKVSDHDETDVDIITSRLQSRINSQLTLYNDTRLAYYTRNFATTVPGCTGQCAIDFFAGGNPIISFGGGNPTFDQQSWGFQNIASGVATLNIGGFKHEAVAGIDVFYQEDDRPGYGQFGANGVAKPTAAPATATTIRTPDASFYQSYGMRRVLTADRYSDGTEIGLFASDRMWLTPEWSVLGGIRWTDFEYNFEQPYAAPPVDATSQGNYWSPKVSVIWEPSKAESYYASWARSASPVGQFVTNSLNPIATTTPRNEVEENESYEAGAKWSILGGRLGLAGAVFQIEKNGVVVPNPDNPGTVVATGESQQVRGFEFGVTGQLTKAWIMNVGYAYLDSEITGSLTAPANVGNKIGGVPENSVTVWTSYNLSESLISGPGVWTIAGGIVYQSDMFSVNNSANQYIIPYTFSLDGLITYEIDGWRLAANGYNLTDRLNYDSSFNNRAIPAPGRSVLFTVGKQF
jgi:catecholate siderophore receptor